MSAPSAGKEMTPVFFCASHGVIFIDYLEEGKIITGAYYVSLFDQLKAEVAEKRPHSQKKKNLVSPGQCFIAHIIGCHAGNPRITVRTA